MGGIAGLNIYWKNDLIDQKKNMSQIDVFIFTPEFLIRGKFNFSKM